MGLPRRLLWIIAASVPTLTLAIVAVWVLARFLIVHDRLGNWNLTILDKNNAVVGHGHLDIAVKKWHAAWSQSPPFLRFQPELDHPAGHIDLDPAGMEILAHGHQDWQGVSSFDVVNPTLYAADSCVAVYARNDPHTDLLNEVPVTRISSVNGIGFGRPSRYFSEITLELSMRPGESGDWIGFPFHTVLSR